MQTDTSSPAHRHFYKMQRFMKMDALEAWQRLDDLVYDNSCTTVETAHIGHNFFFRLFEMFPNIESLTITTDTFTDDVVNSMLQDYRGRYGQQLQQLNTIRITRRMSLTDSGAFALSHLMCGMSMKLKHVELGMSPYISTDAMDNIISSFSTSRLERLALALCPSYVLPAFSTSWISMRTFRISNVNVTSWLNSISLLCPMMECIMCENCSILSGDCIAGVLRHCPKLRVLILSGMLLRGCDVIATALAEHACLQTLDLHRVHALEDDWSLLMRNIGPAVRHLSVSYTCMGLNALAWMKMLVLPQLTLLHIYGCQLTPHQGKVLQDGCAATVILDPVQPDASRKYGGDRIQQYCTVLFEEL